MVQEYVGPCKWVKQCLQLEAARVGLEATNGSSSTDEERSMKVADLNRRQLFAGMAGMIAATSGGKVLTGGAVAADALRLEPALPAGLRESPLRSRHSPGRSRSSSSAIGRPISRRRSAISTT